MTLPTITYGVGSEDDLGSRTDYSADGAHDDGAFGFSLLVLHEGLDEVQTPFHGGR